MISRQQALELLNEHVKDKVLLFHSLETEAVMRALAERLGKDKELWAITGLLHDLDYEQTRDNPPQHTLETEKILQDYDFPLDAIRAIKAHNWDGLGIRKESDFDIALSAAETITGLIVACALVQPDKKVASVKPKSVSKKLKTKDFARSVNRKAIKECEKLGISLDEFIELSLDAIKKIGDQIGL